MGTTAAAKPGPGQTPKEKLFLARKVMTPEFRVSYPSVFKQRAFDQSQEAKYEITMLFDKAKDLSALRKAAAEAIKQKWGPDKAKWPQGLKLPFKDGDQKQDQPGYKGCTVLKATSRFPIGIVDRDAITPITEADNKFYAGCYARATVVAAVYDTKGNRGVTFFVENIQKTRDGAPFSGRKKPSEEFDSVEDDPEFNPEGGDGLSDTSGGEVDDGLGDLG